MYLEVKDLKKSYGEGGGYVQVLKGITAGVEQGEMCVIQGIWMVVISLFTEANCSLRSSFSRCNISVAVCCSLSSSLSLISSSISHIIRVTSARACSFS